MKNESKAEKIIRKKIEEWTILKPTQMAREITEALIRANLISSNGMLADSSRQDDAWNDLGNTLYEMGNEEPGW